VLSELLEKHTPKQRDERHRSAFHRRPNYFTVHDLDAGMLGRITKAELTKKIVITYARAKSLMDAVNYYAPRYEERDRLSRGTGPEPTRKKWTPDLENGQTRRFESDLRPLRKTYRACSRRLKNTWSPKASKRKKCESELNRRRFSERRRSWILLGLKVRCHAARN
jgi:hypothetical protein